MAGTGFPPYHQQWPPAVVPLPPPNSVAESLRGQQTCSTPAESPIFRLPSEEVRTIFISGLPEDVKERELHNLLRWLPGFEACQVNYKGEHPMGFALFATPQHAIAAKDGLEDLVFDANLKCVLHTEMAKKNLFVKRGMVADSSAYDQSKRMRIGGDYTQANYSTSPFHSPQPPVWNPQGYMARPPPPLYDIYTSYPVPIPAPAPLPLLSNYVPVQNDKDNPPCNTLFIGNLGENINEDELRGIFSSQCGFKQMKVLKQERHTVCFIEFDDVKNATHVHQSLQGAVLPSSGFSFVFVLTMRYVLEESVRKKEGLNNHGRWRCLPKCE
ncbi:hypothetical protein M569_07031 [Genlisea aurea]|uniref:RRM domain-containing protein n=1 Tax=Genlisea aurea TaxID=192259 RepID=S8CLX4_9LAMI|nr:hypothetical protein M569_07031 [Genlisea aurea]